MIEYEELKGAIEESIDAFGNDYIYPHDRCTYVKDGAPSCLIGHALYRLGMSVEELGRHDAADTSAGDLPYFTDKARALASAVQVEQDTNSEWGLALLVGMLRAERPHE